MATIPPTETELLARALFRGMLQTVKLIAAIYGWSIKDENEQMLAEQCPRCRGVHPTTTATLRVGEVRVIKRLKIE